MHKLKVGVIVDVNLAKSLGGTFSYYNTLLSGINNYEFDQAIEIVNVVFYEKTQPEVDFKKPVVFIKGYLNISSKNKLARRVSKGLKSIIKSLTFVNDLLSLPEKIKFRRIERDLARNGIDIIYHLKPEMVDLNYPFIATHWDLAHKSTYPFPELALDGHHESREKYYSNVLNKAMLILCESNAGIEELRYHYSLSPLRIKRLPLFGNSDLQLTVSVEAARQVLNKYGLITNEFFIYPAQFWALKNHYNLIVAFAAFIGEDPDRHFKLVLPGSDMGNLGYIQKLVADLSLDDSVLFPGFVPDQELSVFYRHATAAVMPTFLGPTNMPLIEAARLKCPVLCSNLKGHYEIMGEYALYFEPEDPGSIQNAMELLTGNEEGRTSLADSAYTHIMQSEFDLQKSLSALNTYLLQVKAVRKTWDITN
ncbi:glycosyltransferase family 4 protein [Hufsiella ginkgonis]|uniref:Glycosyltransferase n=1 Tax=Hufsiella ginkgonis TaxID=2695274 RepID=A0A7K1XTA5_9SPHI|nr:glycosyltransferase family 1 protein [Hufsiella ginkgonis]MXV14243.1 glycosyltransferase [Hufsiella ginkgonis]